jgi:hypothetical protein
MNPKKRLLRRLLRFNTCTVSHLNAKAIPIRNGRESTSSRRNLAIVNAIEGLLVPHNNWICYEASSSMSSLTIINKTLMCTDESIT